MEEDLTHQAEGDCADEDNSFDVGCLQVTRPRIAPTSRFAFVGRLWPTSGRPVATIGCDSAWYFRGKYRRDGAVGAGDRRCMQGAAAESFM
jgi:hypothetical protein